MGCLTIYTDASYNQHTKVAGYGYWARDKTYIGKGFGGEPDIRCNTYAEIRAIAYAIFRLTRDHVERVQDKPYCTVVTDSIVALEYYTLGPHMHPVFSGEPYEFVQAVMEKYNIKFNVRKVKAHSGANNPRTYINNTVDYLAKHARTELEKQLEGK